MIITDNRVKSVLRTYTKQLQKAKLPSENLLKGEGTGATSLGTEKVVISEEARQKLLREQFAKQALNRLEQEKRLNGKQESDKAEDENSPTDMNGKYNGNGKTQNVSQTRG
ncbi:MAG: DVU0524 family FlgM-associated protein [Thermodesulforhabdaceae bacterium]